MCFRLTTNVILAQRTRVWPRALSPRAPSPILSLRVCGDCRVVRSQGSLTPRNDGGGRVTRGSTTPLSSRPHAASCHREPAEQAWRSRFSGAQRGLLRRSAPRNGRIGRSSRSLSLVERRLLEGRIAASLVRRCLLRRPCHRGHMSPLSPRVWPHSLIARGLAPPVIASLPSRRGDLASSSAQGHRERSVAISLLS